MPIRHPTFRRSARLVARLLVLATLAVHAAGAQGAQPVGSDTMSSSAVFRLAQARESHDRAGAIALYRRYVALEPRDAWGYMALGDALARSGDLRAALHEYDTAERIAPEERDVYVGRARLLARAGHVDEAIAAYEQWVERTPRDGEAWRELAGQQRRAGRYDEEIASLQHARTAEGVAATAVQREIERAHRAGQATVEPRVSGSRDSDGLRTASAGISLTSPLLGRARLSAATSAGSAGDGISSRGSQDVVLGMELRPMAQLRLSFSGGVARADRSFIDTVTATPSTPPSPGPGRRGSLPIGRPTAAGTSSTESIPVGSARLVWRKPGDAIAVDVRASRQLLDASPYLVAQGVLRDEASLSLDLRLLGPVRVRGFGKLGAVHNTEESNGRQIIGGALAWAPGPYELSLRAQTMRYDTATALAYFSPRRVRTAELGTYLERETDRGVTIALDVGGGAQQVEEWASAASAWSPTFHGWTQVVVPLTEALALGTEIEAYDSRVGNDVRSPTVPASRWRYASAGVSLRVRF
jgi:hypothetical protein